MLLSSLNQLNNSHNHHGMICTAVCIRCTELSMQPVHLIMLTMRHQRTAHCVTCYEVLGRDVGITKQLNAWHTSKCLFSL